MPRIGAGADRFGLAGTAVDGRFRVEEQIAEGGFSVVYRACQEVLDRKVALKVLKTPAGYDEFERAEFHDEFAAEARTIARLKHPSIVDVHDFGVSAMPSGQTAPWIALEWVDGETLEGWLDRRRRAGLGPLSPEEAFLLARPMVDAMAFAHQRDIVHRDIKPANVMLADSGGSRSIRVLDFGIAKIMRGDRHAGSEGTRTDSVPAFSPAYAAPEQVTFSRTGPWTDVHALGLLLTELMTGERPYTGPEVPVHEQVMAAERPTPRRKGRDVGAFEAIIARAVALNAADRWCDATALLAALDEQSGCAQSSKGAAERAGAESPALFSERTVPMTRAIARSRPQTWVSVPGASTKSKRRVTRGIFGVAVLVAACSVASMGLVHAWHAHLRPAAASPPVHATPINASAVAAERAKIADGERGEATSTQARGSSSDGGVAPLPALVDGLRIPQLHRATAALRRTKVDPPPSPDLRGLDVFNDTK